jgi:hypothetical protein
MRRIGLALGAAVLLAAVSCGRLKPSSAGPGDAGAEAPAPGTLRACLDTPADLPRPPSGALPCDLIPPGLELPQ